MPYKPIYVIVTFTLSQTNCSTFLWAVATSGGIITSASTNNLSRPKKQVNKWLMYAKVRFSNLDQLEEFKQCGLDMTIDIPTSLVTEQVSEDEN